MRGEPEADIGRIGNNAVGVGVAEGEAKLDEDVDEEGELAGDVEDVEVRGEPAEEAKLHRGEEGGVHRPEEYELSP